MRVIKVKEVVEEWEEGGKDNWNNNKDKHTQMTPRWLGSKWHITF